MRRLSLAISAITLLSPLTALAAYSTPSALVSAVENGSARSFSVTAQAAAPNATYVSIWANGTQQGTSASEMQVSTKATVDVASGDFKIRLKTEIMVVNGALYVKLDSVDGSMKNVFASFTANLQQHKWLKTDLDMSMIDMVQNPAFSMSETDLMNSDSTFQLSNKATKGGTTYTLTLKPDAAAQLALTIRDLLQDKESTSDDFFPWRDLAEGMHFEMNVQTDAKDMFTGSSYAMSTKGKQSSFTLTGTEKPAAAMKLTAPKDAITLDDLSAMFASEVPGYLDGMPSDSMMSEPAVTPTNNGMMNDSSSSSSAGATFDSIDTSSSASADPSCNDPSIDPLHKLMMQRDGTCPVSKTPTRYGW